MAGSLLAWFKLDVGEGAFYAVFGFVFVFVGILLLIAIFSLLGFAMKKTGGRKKKKSDPEEGAQTEASALPVNEGVPEETVAAIAAALTAYYEGEKTKCAFVVRRIKKL